MVAYLQMRIGLMGWNDAAVGTLRLLSKPFNEGGRVCHLALGFAQGLPALRRHDEGQVILVIHDEVEHFPKNLGSFFGRHCAPFLECLMRNLNGVVGFIRSHISHLPNFFTCTALKRKRLQEIAKRVNYLWQG